MHHNSIKQKSIPSETLEFFDISIDHTPHKISGGMFNKTYFAQDVKGKKWIIQSINHAIEPKVVENADIILSDLREKGWLCPQYKRGKNDYLYYKKDDVTWRVMNYVENTPFDNSKIALDFYHEMGELLARFHKDLSTTNYLPEHKIEGYHEQEYYLKKSDNIDWDAQGSEVAKIAQQASDFIKDHGSIFKERIQLIHSDARVENTFMDSDMKPFLFIDYDTFMNGSIYIDVGDCVRSLILVSPDQSAKEITKAFVKGYNAQSTEEISYDDAVISMKLLTVELTLRFLIDVVEDYYFDWDDTQFDSRKEHNAQRATDQWAAYKKTKEDLGEK